MTNKKCPMKFTATRNGNDEYPFCDENMCMWYDSNKEECSISLIPQAIEWLKIKPSTEQV